MGLLAKVTATDWQRPSVVVLMLANLVSVYGIVVLRWDVFPTVLLYWLENVIVGLYNVSKIMLAELSDPCDPYDWWGVGKLMLPPFFCVHYGLFALMHGVIVFALFGGGRRFSTAELIEVISEYQLGYALCALWLSHGFSFAQNVLGHGEYKRTPGGYVLAEPYLRVGVLSLVLMFFACLLSRLGSPITGMVVFALLKVGVDVEAHVREHNRIQFGASSPADSAVHPGSSPSGQRRAQPGRSPSPPRQASAAPPGRARLSNQPPPREEQSPVPCADPPVEGRALPIVFRCPQCNYLIEAAPELAELCMDCPKCSSVVMVPEHTSVGTAPPQ